MVQRYYDPLSGRFLSVDPVASDLQNGWNFNRYNYANNNPYRFTDPDGRLACTGAVPKSECVRPASPFGDGRKPSFGAGADGAEKANRKLTFGEKLGRNLRWFGDSISAEGWAGWRAGAKVKLGPLKASLQLGMAKYGIGATFGDIYGFADVGKGRAGPVGLNS